MQDFRAYTTIKEPCEVLQVIKKSKFYGRLFPVQTPEEAQTIVDDCKKKYWDASHNCSAYVIGKMGELSRCSDDGEPSGTAGKPMLDVLLGEELHNTAVVVTRYFGGTLLGTGGLVRAYSSAVKAGLASSVIITKKQGIKLEITTEYTGLGKIQYILAEKGMTVLDTLYTDKVEMTVLVPARELEGLKAAIMEGTNGRVRMEEGETCYYAEIEGKNRVLED